jgi:hypothetical protein
MNTVQLLTETRKLLSDPARHTTNEFARTQSGVPCDVADECAFMFCAIGGLRYIGRHEEVVSDAKHYLQEAIHEMVRRPYIANFNDNHPHHEIMAAFDRAAELARAAQPPEKARPQ